MRTLSSKQPRAITSPGADELLDAVLELGREAHIESTTAELVERFLDVVGGLFAERALAVRVLDGRTAARPELFVRGGKFHHGVADLAIRLKQSSITKTRLKSAIASSARVKVSTRWDSPFEGLAIGFSIPLVAAGELYGVLDVGYPLDADAKIERDESALLPIANWLSLSLRQNLLHSETMLLRDYQARLIEHANALILGVDRNWRITVANKALCTLTEYDRDEVVGQDVRDWLPEAQFHRLTGAVSSLAVHGGTANHVEVELTTKRGETIRSVWSLAAVGRPGAVQAVVAIGQDQTRLFELQSQVIQAEKLATLGQLAAGVVHELNNPLTSISVYAEFLLKKAERRGETEASEDGDVVKLSRIVAGAQRIKSFARDLVQYAKPAGDERMLVSINAIVRQSLSFCEHLFGRSNVELEVELSEELPSALAVSGQIEQVVINLVTNAVHACEGSGKVAVITEPSGSGLAIRIGDSGTGISPESMSRVFEPFFTTKADGRGTGLGLSIVRNIMEQHGGEVRVSKSKYGGAELICELPVGAVSEGDNSVSDPDLG